MRAVEIAVRDDEELHAFFNKHVALADLARSDPYEHLGSDEAATQMILDSVLGQPVTIGRSVRLRGFLSEEIESLGLALVADDRKDAGPSEILTWVILEELRKVALIYRTSRKELFDHENLQLEASVKSSSSHELNIGDQTLVRCSELDDLASGMLAWKTEFSLDKYPVDWNNKRNIELYCSSPSDL